jgi:hypothetical protein
MTVQQSRHYGALMETEPGLPVDGELRGRLLLYAEDCARNLGAEAGRVTLFHGTVHAAEMLSGSASPGGDEPAWVLAVEPAEGSFVHPRLGPAHPKHGFLLALRVRDASLFLRSAADTPHGVTGLGAGQVLKPSPSSRP